MIQCDILTLFPEMLEPIFGQSILKRAIDKHQLYVHIHDLRAFTTDKHRVTDDVPYGGGGGMLLKPEPIFAALDLIREERGEIRVILPSPQGKHFDQAFAEDFACEKLPLVFICGHYEGIDARVNDGISLEEISVGDYILTGGEIPAALMIDAATRLVPGVLGGVNSAQEESFSTSLLEHPHYTRPFEYRGMKVPDVLTSGNHAKIRNWRREQTLINTLEKRPDLLAEAPLTPSEKAWVAKLDLEISARSNRTLI